MPYLLSFTGIFLTLTSLSEKCLRWSVQSIICNHKAFWSHRAVTLPCVTSFAYSYFIAVALCKVLNHSWRAGTETKHISTTLLPQYLWSSVLKHIAHIEAWTAMVQLNTYIIFNMSVQWHHEALWSWICINNHISITINLNQLTLQNDRSDKELQHLALQYNYCLRGEIRKWIIN